jgi:tetratricopeptide (TPR) repeat protein
MKSTITTIIFGLLILLQTQSNAQYNKMQIDSLLDRANRVSNLKEGLKLATSAYNASKAINYEEGIVRSLLSRAVKYSNARHYEEAFKSAVGAESAAIELNNPRYLALIAAMKGINYTNLGFYDEGKKELLSAIDIAKDIADPDIKHARLGNIYSALLENNRLSKGDEKTSMVYARKSYIELSKIKNKTKFLNTIGLPIFNLGNAFLTLKQNDSAEFYLKKAVIIGDKYKEDICRGMAFNGLGDLYFQKKDYQASEINYKKAIPILSKTNLNALLKDAYLGLSKTFAAQNNELNARKYLERSVELSDSLDVVEKAAIKTPLGYIVKYKEQQAALNRKKYLQIISAIVVLLLIVISIVLFYRRNFKKKLRLNLEKIDELIKRIELNDSSQELTSKTEELKEIVQLAVNNDPIFFTKYNEFDPEFSKKLLSLNPGLIATEIEFCILLKLSFETKEIARYTDVSVRSVEGKKHRIRKKLAIPSNQDINIWMNHL